MILSKILITLLHVKTKFSILIFVSPYVRTFKKEILFEPMEFSKNGVFHSKGRLTIFSA